MRRAEQLLYGPRKSTSRIRISVPWLDFDQLRAEVILQIEAVVAGQAAIDLRSIRSAVNERAAELTIRPHLEGGFREEITVLLHDQDGYHLRVSGLITRDETRHLHHRLHNRLDNYYRLWPIKTVAAVMPGREILAYLDRGQRIEIEPISFADKKIDGRRQVETLMDQMYREGNISDHDYAQLIRMCEIHSDNSSEMLNDLAANSSGRRLLEENSLAVIRHFDR